MGTKGFKHLTAKQTIAIHADLQELLRVVREDSDRTIVSYIDDHSDHTVAAKHGVGLSCVARLRQQTFGHLNAPPKAQQPAPHHDVVALNATVAELRQGLKETRDLVDDLKGAVQRMGRFYDALVDKHDKLAMTLSVGRVADVRHLRVNGGA